MNQPTIQISAGHRSLKMLLMTILKEKRRTSDADSIWGEAEFCDFGLKFKVVTGSRRELHVTIPDGMRRDGLDKDGLRQSYGKSLKAPPSNNSSFAFSVDLDEAVEQFDTIEACAERLSSIRLDVLGSPLLKALEGISTGGTQSKISTEQVHKLFTNPRYGNSYCLTGQDK